MSNDYFTNRQDRYVVFKDCKELCDYFDELVQTISTFSFQLSPEDETSMRQDFPFHPYESNKTDYNNAAGKLISNFMAKHAERNSFTPDKIIELMDSGGVEDTLVFPLLQMREMGVHQDEEVTYNMISSAPACTNLLLATAYFNLTDRYWDAVVANACENRLVMAHPKAMGFYQAAGMAGLLSKFC